MAQYQVFELKGVIVNDIGGYILVPLNAQITIYPTQEEAHLFAASRPEKCTVLPIFTPGIG